MKHFFIAFFLCFTYSVAMAQSNTNKETEKEVTVDTSVDKKDGKKVTQKQIIIEDSNGNEKVISLRITEGGATEISIVEEGKTQNFRLNGTPEEIEAEMKKLGIEIEALNKEVDGSMSKSMKIDTPNPNDSTKVKIGGVEIIIHEKKEKKIEHEDKGKEIEEEIIIKDAKETCEKDVRHKTKNSMRFALLDIGINTYHQNGTFEYTGNAADMRLVQGKSLDWVLHIFRHRIGLYKNMLNLQYGVGVNFNNYHFSEPITLIKNSTPLEIVSNDAVEYRKNKLYASYLHLPLMLNIETNPRKKSKSFHLSGGMYGAVLLASRTKQCLDDDDADALIRRDDYHLNSFRYGVGGQIGYGPINFYANYSLRPLFQDKAGGTLNELYPLSIGLSILGF